MALINKILCHQSGEKVESVIDFSNCIVSRLFLFCRDGHNLILSAYILTTCLLIYQIRVYNKGLKTLNKQSFCVNKIGSRFNLPDL